MSMKLYKFLYLKLISMKVNLEGNNLSDLSIAHPPFHFMLCYI